MKTCTAIVMFVLAVGMCMTAVAAAQGGSTLTERIAAAIAGKEPAWQPVEPFRAAPGGSLEPFAEGRWREGGTRIEIAVRVFESSAAAAKALEMHEAARAIRIVRPAPRDFGDRAYMTFASRSVEISFQKRNVFALVGAIGPTPATTGVSDRQTDDTSLARRAARIVDDAIAEDVVVTECVNGLMSDARPTPRGADERLFRAVESGCVPEFRAALDAGANPNARDGRTTVLAAVAEHRRVEMVRQLLKAGADFSDTIRILVAAGGR